MAKKSVKSKEIKVPSSSCKLIDTPSAPSTHTEVDVVKQLSQQQRWPSPDDPVCIICGKYGEYICDETDEDVCSVECKHKHLQVVNKHETTSVSKYETLDNTKQVTDAHVPAASEDTFDSYYAANSVNVPRKDLNNMTTEKLDFFREKFEIHVTGNHIPKMMLSFAHCGFSEQLCHNLKEHHYVTPTAVQMQVIPIALQGRDALVSATTSSGKTASFLLPIAQRIHNVLGMVKFRDHVQIRSEKIVPCADFEQLILV